MPIVKAFMAVSTQWRIIPIGQATLFYQGLIYTDVRAGLSAEGIVLTPPQWSGLRAMEAAAAAILNKVRG